MKEYSKLYADNGVFKMNKVSEQINQIANLEFRNDIAYNLIFIVDVRKFRIVSTS